VNPALQGYLAAMEESLAASGALSTAADELRAVADLVDASTELTLAIDDGSVPVAARRALLDDLLADKVRTEVVRLVHQAITVVPAAEVTASLHWLCTRVTAAADHARTEPTAARPEEPALGRLASRNRVWGYAAAVFEAVSVDALEEIEDELFRFARTVEANRPLRTAFGDRDLPTAERQGLAAQLLSGKVSEATERLVAYAIRGGRARDFVWTLDSLVEAAAQARGWRVAKVRSAEPVADDQQRQLREALAVISGQPVELQVTIDSSLLAGAVVEVGDLFVNGTVRHRLEELREQFAASTPVPTVRISAPTPREEHRQ
jgi:F-type H+-transporting ATPase subunit delta